jgi:hypothetical protein
VISSAAIREGHWDGRTIACLTSGQRICYSSKGPLRPGEQCGLHTPQLQNAPLRLAHSGAARRVTGWSRPGKPQHHFQLTMAARNPRGGLSEAFNVPAAQRALHAAQTILDVGQQGKRRLQMITLDGSGM